MLKNFIAVLGPMAVLTGCQQSPEPSSTSMERNNLNLIVIELASNNEWMTATAIETLRETGKLKFENAQIGNREFQSVLAKTGPDGDLITYDIVVEMDKRVSPEAFPSAAPASGQVMQNRPYWVALDPDEYFFPNIEEEDRHKMPDITLPTFYHNGVGGEPEKRVITVKENVTFHEPLFYVSIIPQVTPQTGLPINGTFLALYGVDLLVSHDINQDEFEVFVSDGDSPGTVSIRTHTLHTFDGRTQPDASGRNRLYKDINEEMIAGDGFFEEPIALRILDGTTFRIMAIEDDNPGSTRGVYERSSGTQSYKAMDYYDMAGNLIQRNRRTFFRNETGRNNDDRYLSSGVRAINEVNLSNRLAGSSWFETVTATNGNLTSVNWRLGKVTY